MIPVRLILSPLYWIFLGVVSGYIVKFGSELLGVIIINLTVFGIVFIIGVLVGLLVSGLLLLKSGLFLELMYRLPEDERSEGKREARRHEEMSRRYVPLGVYSFNSLILLIFGIGGAVIAQIISIYFTLGLNSLAPLLGGVFGVIIGVGLREYIDEFSIFFA